MALDEDEVGDDGDDDDDAECLILLLDCCCPAMENSFKCPHLAALERYKNCTIQNLRCSIGPNSIPNMNCGNVSIADRNDDSRITSRTNVDRGVITQGE